MPQDVDQRMDLEKLAGDFEVIEKFTVTGPHQSAIELIAQAVRERDEARATRDWIRAECQRLADENRQLRGVVEWVPERNPYPGGLTKIWLGLAMGLLK